MKRPITKLDMMRAASLIQNPMVAPRTITPQDVRPTNEAVLSAFTQAQVPKDARDVQGASGGVMKAERTKAEIRNA